MLYQIVIVIHILLGIGIIGLVLMQRGKGADAGAAFGSGASGSVFGAQGSASFLSRSTAVFATMFFMTSLGLAFLSGYQGKKTQDIILDAPAKELSSDVPLSQATVSDTPVAAVSEAPVVNEAESVVEAVEEAPVATAPVDEQEAVEATEAE